MYIILDIFHIFASFFPNLLTMQLIFVRKTNFVSILLVLVCFCLYAAFCKIKRKFICVTLSFHFQIRQDLQLLHCWLVTHFVKLTNFKMLNTGILEYLVSGTYGGIPSQIPKNCCPSHLRINTRLTHLYFHICPRLTC